MSRIGLDAFGNPVQVITPGDSASLSFNATSAQSSVIGSVIVRVVATADCYLEFGADPTATTESMFLPALVVEYFSVRMGWKIAAIQKSAGGTLHITESD